MKTIRIEENYKNEILKMHGFIKEQGPTGVDDNIPTENPQPSEPKKVEAAQVTDDIKLAKAIEAGCLPGPKTKIRKGAKSGKFIYVDTTKAGKVIYFYADGTWILQDKSKSGKWECPALKTEPKPVSDPTKVQGSAPVLPPTPLKPEEKQLQNMGAQQVTSALDQILINLKTNFGLEACTSLVDSYFEAAQDGEPNPKLTEYKDAVYRCNRNHMKDWKKETKDKLRWLRGDEQDAKRFAGLFKRFSKDFGTITSDTKRVQWILDRLPKVN